MMCLIRYGRVLISNLEMEIPLYKQVAMTGWGVGKMSHHTLLGTYTISTVKPSTRKHFNSYDLRVLQPTRYAECAKTDRNRSRTSWTGALSWWRLRTSRGTTRPFNVSLTNSWWNTISLVFVLHGSPKRKLNRITITRKQACGGTSPSSLEKSIFILEITISWIDNRDKRYDEKVEKYEAIRRNIVRDEPDYTVDQITLVMDSLGGYSKNLRENIGKIFKDSKMVDKIIRKMQKSVLNGSVHTSRCFKLETQL